MSFLAAIIVFSFFFWNWIPFLRLLLKVFFPLSERRINFLIYFVGMLSLPFLLEIIMLVLASLFLRLFAEIIVEASDYLD
jgi:hypothetical protein